MSRSRSRSGSNRITIATISLCLLIAACTPQDPGDTSNRVDNEPTGAPRLASGAVYTPPEIESVTKPPKDWFAGACELPLEVVLRTMRGHDPQRSPELLLIPHGSNYIGDPENTSHSGPWDYLQKVPLVLYGPGFIEPQGELRLDREVTVADLAPTIAELIDFEWPTDGPGRSISEALVPKDERRGRPKVVVVVVWDGAGTNVLDAWPGTWPHLERFGQQGVAVADAIVGSSPSITPAIHTTIGTGVFPDQHGIVGIVFRENGRISLSFPASAGGLIKTPTLADDYDPSTDNAAKIGMVGFRSWHLGMIGHGANYPGGDQDVAVLVNKSEELFANEDVYSLPPQLKNVRGLRADIRKVDASDGERDGKWMGHDIVSDTKTRRDSPVWALYQTRLLTKLIATEGFGADAIPDLLYTNYKQIDEAGHNWNMLSEEMPDEIRYADAALGDLATYLNEQVGRNSWVIAVTSDHGQTPDPEVSGGWPIASGELAHDLSEAFGLPAGSLVEKASRVGVFLDRKKLAKEKITLEEVADFASRYRLEDNVREGQPVPEMYQGREKDLLFAAAFPGVQIGRVRFCVEEREASSD